MKDELAVSDARGRSSGWTMVQRPFIGYLSLEREIRDRDSDRFAALAYRPPDWVTSTLGERPVDHERRAVWDAVVDWALQYRTDHGIPEDVADLLGPQPPSSDIGKRVARIAARRAVHDVLRFLTMAQEHGRSAISR